MKAREKEIHIERERKRKIDRKKHIKSAREHSLHSELRVDVSGPVAFISCLTFRLR